MKELIEIEKHGKYGATLYFAADNWKVREGLILAYERLRKSSYDPDFVDHNIFCGLRIFVEGIGSERIMLIREVKEIVKKAVEETLKNF